MYFVNSFYTLWHKESQHSHFSLSYCLLPSFIEQILHFVLFRQLIFYLHYISYVQMAKNMICPTFLIFQHCWPYLSLVSYEKSILIKKSYIVFGEYIKSSLMKLIKNVFLSTMQRFYMTHYNPYWRIKIIHVPRFDPTYLTSRKMFTYIKSCHLI